MDTFWIVLAVVLGIGFVMPITGAVTMVFLMLAGSLAQWLDELGKELESYGDIKGTLIFIYFLGAAVYLLVFIFYYFD